MEPDEVNANNEVKPSESKFYASLCARLTKSEKELPNHIGVAKSASFKCSRCPHVSGNKTSHWRHEIKRHLLRKEVKYFAFCPVRTCKYTAGTFNMIRAHLISNHPGTIKIKTVIHGEELASGDGDKDSDDKSTRAEKKFSCPFSGCDYRSSKKGLGTHKRWHHSNKSRASKRSKSTVSAMTETALSRAVFSLSNKGSNILVDEHLYHYIKQQSRGDVTYWTCRRRKALKCAARAQTIKINGTQYITSLHGEHVHSSQIIKARMAVKEKESVKDAVRNPSLHTRKALADLLIQQQTDDSSNSFSTKSAQPELATPTAGEKKIYHCPVEGCGYTKSRRNAITTHMNKHHPDEPKPETISPVIVKDTENVPPEATTTPQVEEKKYLYLCPIEGCEFAKKNKGTVSKHMNQEHPDQFRTNIPRTEIKEDEDISDISLATGTSSATKSGRVQKTKKRFIEEEWQVYPSRSKRIKIQETEATSDIVDLPDNIENKVTIEVPATNVDEKPREADTDDVKLKQQTRVRLTPLVISFPPAQQCLIHMSKTHNIPSSSIDYNMTKGDGMLSMLIGEHVVGCSACVQSPDVRLSALQLGWERFGGETLKKENELLKQRIQTADSELKKLMARINFLETKLVQKTKKEIALSTGDPKLSHQQPETVDEAMILVERKQIENKKLINRISQLENDLRTMHKNMNKDASLSQCSDNEKNLKLLEGVQKPVLQKKNDYWMVQGHRILDINILRVALETAQTCGHCDLVLTEVNVESSKIDLATQLAFLCKQCGFQTLFYSSSFSEEWPSNFAVNKSFLAAMGATSYLTLCQLVKSSTSAIKVNLKQRGKANVLRKKAKLLISMDRKSYTEDLGIDKSGEDTEEVLVTPDLTATYESITDETDDYEDSKPEQFHDSPGLPYQDLTFSQDFEFKEEPALELARSRIGEQSEDSKPKYNGINIQAKEKTENDGLGIEGANNCVDSINNSLSNLLEKIEGEEDNSTNTIEAATSNNVSNTSEPDKASDEIKPEIKPLLKIKPVDHLVDKTRLNRASNSPEKSMAESSWNIVQDPLQQSPGNRKDVTYATPIPPGTRLLASTIKHTTTAETPLPPGVYKIKKGSEEFVMVVKKDNEALEASQNKLTTNISTQAQNMNLMQGTLTSTGWRFNDSVSTSKPLTAVSSGSRFMNLTGKMLPVSQQLQLQRGGIVSSQTSNAGMYKINSVVASTAGGSQIASGRLAWTGRMGVGNPTAPPRLVRIAPAFSSASGTSAASLTTQVSSVQSNMGVRTTQVSSGHSQGNIQPNQSKTQKVVRRSIGSFVLPKTHLPEGWVRNAIKAVNKETHQCKISVIIRPPNSSILLHNKHELLDYTRKNNLPDMNPQLFDIQLSNERQAYVPDSDAVPRTSITQPSIKPLKTTPPNSIRKEENKLVDIGGDTEEVAESLAARKPTMEMINMGGKKVIAPAVLTTTGSGIILPKISNSTTIGSISISRTQSTSETNITKADTTPDITITSVVSIEDDDGEGTAASGGLEESHHESMDYQSDTNEDQLEDGDNERDPLAEDNLETDDANGAADDTLEMDNANGATEDNLETDDANAAAEDNLGTDDVNADDELHSNDTESCNENNDDEVYQDGDGKVVENDGDNDGLAIDEEKDETPGQDAKEKAIETLTEIEELSDVITDISDNKISVSNTEELDKIDHDHKVLNGEMEI